jgi:hypothetical protein
MYNYQESRVLCMGTYGAMKSLNCLLLTVGNRALFKQREKQYKKNWAPKVPEHSGEAHAAQKAEAELRRPGAELGRLGPN